MSQDNAWTKNWKDNARSLLVLSEMVATLYNAAGRQQIKVTSQTYRQKDRQRS